MFHKCHAVATCFEWESLWIETVFSECSNCLDREMVNKVVALYIY